MKAERWRMVAVVSLAMALLETVSNLPEPLRSDEPRFVESARDLLADSRFPPGWPMMLAPWSWSVGAMQVVAMICGLALVGLIWWAAVRLGGWRAGVAAGVLIVLSPGITTAGQRLMSDGPGALFVVAALVAVIHGRERLAGVLLGFSGWIRLVHVAFCAALPRRAWAAAGMMVAGLVAWQLAVKGSLFGYSAEEASFGLEHVVGESWYEVTGVPSNFTNVGLFVAVLTGMESFLVGDLVGPQLLAPFVLVPAVVGFRRHWGPVARFAATVTLLNLLVYLPYFFQSMRFMLPGGCLMVVFAAAAFGEGSEGDAVVLGQGRLEGHGALTA